MSCSRLLYYIISFRTSTVTRSIKYFLRDILELYAARCRLGFNILKFDNRVEHFHNDLLCNWWDIFLRRV